VSGDLLFMPDGPVRRLRTFVAFAGGGGSSKGIKLAIGHDPDAACNHDDDAIAMHAANHPACVHFTEDVWRLKLRDVIGKMPLDLLWASPDCKHFSKAKGGKPVSKKIRGLAWFVTKSAAQVRPRVIIVENVEEFKTWGPLVDDRPDQRRRGETFRRWVRSLEKLGYVVDFRELRACDYGTPTTRKRLFVIARCDGKPIVWPAPTHGPGRPLPWRTAADCINWTIPCPSIFDRKKPLAAATQRRIARGIVKYVIGAAHPFVVKFQQNGAGCDVTAPLDTVMAGAPRFGLVAPSLIQTSYGERKGQAPRTLDLGAPLGTVVAGGVKHGLVAAFLAKHYGGPRPSTGTDIRRPVDTVTAVDHHSLVTSSLVKLRGTCRDGQPVTQPMPTITASGTHVGEVRAFLTKFYGTGGDQDVRLPLGTVTTRDRFGLVVVDGEEYEIADIGFRMLTPRELFRAQGFPDDYVIDVGGLTKTAQVRNAGNAVCPQVAEALVRANLVDVAAQRMAA
jgi:DNA (cytosine-5)-methyltransferase 1